jgi:hypothetical protein
MTTPTVTETRRHGHQIDERVELARYTISSGERVLYGQRVDGVVRLIDRPASAEGRSFLVERELEQDGAAALRALVDDYLEQSRVYDEVPMLVSSIPSGLGQLDTREADR